MYKKKEFLTFLILIDNDEDKVLLFDRNPFYSKWNDDIKNFSQINYILHEEDILDLKFINENKDIIGSEDYNTWLKTSEITNKFLYIKKVLGTDNNNDNY